MYYCENCHLLNEEPVCGYCGAAHLRNPEERDFCFLASLASPWSEALTELLEDEQIPSAALPRRQLPAGYSADAFQKTEIYVPYSAWERAKELKKNLLESEPAGPEE